MAVDYEDLGRKIRNKRKKIRLSQAELAERVDLSVQHISNIENARTKVGLEKLVDISNGKINIAKSDKLYADFA